MNNLVDLSVFPFDTTFMQLPLFLIPIIVGISAQGLKHVFNRHMTSHVKVGGVSMPRYGGMPSAHTAFAMSLVTLVGLADGVLTTTFAITVAGAIFILDDALRMRIFLERHGRAVYQLIKKLPQEERKSFPTLETRLGHKPLEVIAGAVFGLVFTFFLYILFQ